MKLPDYDLGDLAKLPLLTAAQEKDLARARDAGDTTAVDTLVRHNVRLTFKVAALYSTRMHRVEFEDIINEGIFGLRRAAEKFSADAGTRFSTYARFWIHQATLTYIQECVDPIRVPRHVHESVGAVNRRRESLADAGVYVSFAEAAETTPLTASRRRLAIQGESLAFVGKLPSYRDGNDYAIESQAVDLDPDSEVERMNREDRLARVRKKLRILNARERIVIKARYLDDEPETLEGLGRLLKVSKERVRQIEVQAINKLRGALVA